MNTVIRRIALTAAVLVGVGLLVVAGRFLLQPGAAAAGFGVPAAAGDPFLAVKGIRDLGTALVLLVLAATGQVRALGWVMLLASVIPLGDMTVVLVTGGSPVVAFGVHAATALVAIAAGLGLLLTGRGAVALSR